MRPKGYLTLKHFLQEDGSPLSVQDAIDRGVIADTGLRAPASWKFDKTCLPLGKNLFVDQGRQMLAYAFGFRSPISNFVCTQFGIGTGSNPPAVTDVALQSPLTFYDPLGGTSPTSTVKPITKASFPYPFIIDIEMTLAYSEANGQLITEFGLFTGSSGGGGSTLLARKVVLGYNKNSALSPVFVWRIRM
jgi:hypothetical protein